jgi:hypothetical protein
MPQAGWFAVGKTYFIKPHMPIFHSKSLRISLEIDGLVFHSYAEQILLGPKIHIY